MVDPLSTRDLIKRLGTFLADLTMDRPPARIHADILERLRETWQQPDPQLSGVYFDDKDFASVWIAIRNGASLPINSWDTVVLPVIAFYSSREAFKPNMETAIHLWGQARSSLSNVLEGPKPSIVPVYEVMDEQTPDTLAAMLSSAPAAPERVVPAPRRSRKRWLVAGLASLLILLAAVAVVRYGDAGKEPFAGTIPRNVTTGGPIGIPTADPSSFLTPSAEASPTLEPSVPPAETPSMAPGVVAPTAPRSAAVAGKTHTTVTLSWQPPTNAGTRGLSHYRIFKGMAEIGSTMNTSFTISSLLAKTTYVFSVMAVNKAGASSPSSNAVSVTTDAAPVGPPRPPATVRTNPGPFISYGLAFSVIGDDWPCTAPTQVDIYLRNELIASPTTDDKGHFDVSIEIIDDIPNAMIRITNRPDEYLILQRDAEETVKAVLTSHPQCSSTEVKTTHVTFN